VLASEKQKNYYKSLVKKLKSVTNWTNKKERDFYEINNLIINHHLENISSQQISKAINDIKGVL